MILEKVGLLPLKPLQLFNRSCKMPGNDRDLSSSPDVPAASSFAEKRRERRYVTFEEVEVCILGAESRCVQAILRDVSRSGLGLMLGVAVKAGAHLEIVLRDRAIIFGEVRYCRRSSHAYQVGVVIEDIYYPKGDSADATQNERLNRDSAWPCGALGLDRGLVTGGSETLAHDQAQGFAGTHVGPDDAAAFLNHDLSDTRTTLVERHLAACEECSRLMRMILEDHTLFVTKFGNGATEVQ
jgi:hypothetical protein